MQFDVVIPTRGGKNVHTILSCISLQSLLPVRIILVVNGFEGPWDTLAPIIDSMIPENISDRVVIVPIVGELSGNASYARNKGRESTHSQYVYFLDDDNIFDSTFFAHSIAEYILFKQQFSSDILYSPTIQRRQTSTIQSQGIKAFHYLCGWPEPVIFGGWKSYIVSYLRLFFPLPAFYTHTGQYTRASMIGGNSLLSTRKIYDTYPFDEKIAFVYEDIDMSGRITKNNIPLIISHNVCINHMERNKNRLEQSFLALPATAYKKSYNRILFVKKKLKSLAENTFLLSRSSEHIVTHKYIYFASWLKKSLYSFCCLCAWNMEWNNE